MLVLKEKYKKMLAESDEPMIICKPGYDAVCIDLNKKYEKLLGYSREELLNKSTHFLASPDEKHENLTKHASLDGKVVTWDNVHLIKKDGTKFPASASSFPLTDEQNNLFGYAHVVKDMTNAPSNSKPKNSEPMNPEPKNGNHMTYCTKCPACYPLEYQECPACGTNNPENS